MDSLPICGKRMLALDFRSTSPIPVPLENLWRAGFNLAQKLHPDHLAALLDRLGPDPDQAGERYVDLGRRLRTIFTYRRCRDVDELVDETLDRAGRRLLELGDRYDGSEPSRYVFGVAWNVARESFRRRSPEPLPEGQEIPDPGPDDPEETEELRDTCLDRCLGRLPGDDRSLALTYYQGEKGARIQRRADLARELGVSLNALRLKVHRLTRHLRQCMLDCVGAGPEPATLPVRPGPHLVKG
jgi:DNA-directed RNA polymerase specialized sigma24 family protein